MKNCKKCGNENREGALFCDKCGKRLESRSVAFTKKKLALIIGAAAVIAAVLAVSFTVNARLKNTYTAVAEAYLDASADCDYKRLDSLCFVDEEELIDAYMEEEGIEWRTVCVMYEIYFEDEGFERGIDDMRDIYEGIRRVAESKNDKEAVTISSEILGYKALEEDDIDESYETIEKKLKRLGIKLSDFVDRGDMTEAYRVDVEYTYSYADDAKKERTEGGELTIVKCDGKWKALDAKLTVLGKIYEELG